MTSARSLCLALGLLAASGCAFASSEGGWGEGWGDWSYKQKNELPDTPLSRAAKAVKNRPIAGGWTFSLGGSAQQRFQKLDNRRDFNEARNDEDVSLLSRTRLNAEFKYGKMVKVFVEAQDAWEFWRDRLPGTNPNENALDLYQAYVEIGLIPDIVDKPSLVLKLGRQELVLGHRHLFSENDWLNLGQSYDLARVTWRPDGFDIDAFAGWPVVQDHRNLDHTGSHDNLAGVNVKALGIPHGHTVEGTIAYKWNDKINYVGERGIRDGVQLWTLAGRADGRFFKNWDYETELALQTGERGTDNVYAWGGFAQVGYTWKMGWWRTLRLAAQYSRESGDKDPRDGISNTFDPLFGDQFRFHSKLLAAGPKNLEDIAARLTAKVWKGGTLEIDYHLFRLDKATDAFYQSNGRPLRRSVTGRGGREAGREFDVQATHAFNENLSISGGVFLFDPGRLFEETGTRAHDNATSFFFMVRTNF
ncbi:MAG: alginate export family protein [Planctomycetota bacterium]|nr:alginate export family protein [Planctomycetota bacterium]